MANKPLEYLTIMKETADKLDEDIDRITLEPLALMRREGCYRHQTIPLIADGRIQYWDTATLYQWLDQNRKGEGDVWIHPVNRRPLNPDECKYIKHYHECLEWEIVTFLRYPDEKEIVANFMKQNGHLSSVESLPLHAVRTARAILSPRNFAAHFKDYPPLEGHNIQYEREQAIQELRTAVNGTWLLRHSSLNRPKDPHHAKLREKLGVRFYALSYKTDVGGKEKIQHSLILHRPGMGWSQISNVIYHYNTITHVGSPQFHVCFLDLLVAMFQGSGLRFSNCVSGYCDPVDVDVNI